MNPAHHTFTGSVIRVAQQSPEDPQIVWESWFLSLLPDRQQAESMFERIYQRVKTKWWMFDAWDFVDAPKGQPAMIYQRRIATNAPSQEFVTEYFDAPYTLQENFDPYAPRARGFDPAVRGSTEARARELALYRQVERAEEDDPWFDVNFAYEHFAARTLLGRDGLYVEAVWLFSTGKDESPREVLLAALDREARRSATVVIGVVGPYPANESAMISTGMRVFRAYRRFDGGLAEFESKVVDLSHWS